MITSKCESVKDSVKFTELLPFQGNLKKRSDEDIQKLASSLQTDGLLMPFVVWVKNELKYILDGHARHQAIQYIAETEPEVLSQEYPVIVIEAETLEEAKNALLQISSSYGKITPKGLTEFLATAPNIKIENTGIRIKPAKVRLPQTESTTQTADYVVMRIRMHKNVVKDVTSLLAKARVEIL